MDLIIEAQARTQFGKFNKKLRVAGMLPAILYGKGKESLALQVQSKAFDRVYRQAGENTLINLVIDDKDQRKVLIHDVAKHYMKDEAIHVDFYEVDLTRKIHAKIPLEFMGVAPAVKESGGILIKNINEIEVEAMPGDLPHNIEVNIEVLKTFADRIHLGDLKVTDKVKILGHAEDVIVSVQPPRTEAELAELEKPTAEAEKQAVEALTKEEEVPAEGGEPEKTADKADLPAEASKVEKAEEKPAGKK